MDKTNRILIVDDKEIDRDLLVAMVESLGYEPEIAADGIEAIAKLYLDIDVVLLDVMMPGLDGFEVTSRIRDDQKFSDLPIIMVTALTDKESRLRAVEAGANDYITKPVDKVELKIRMESMLRTKEAQDAVRQHEAELENKVKERTTQLRKALNDSVKSQRVTEKAFVDTVNRLSVAAEYKNEDTANHIKRVSNYSALIARGLRLSPGKVEIIRYASPMHDVGKIGIPDAMLLKPGKLTDDEWKIMKQHTIIGGRILNGSDSELLQAGEVIALSHHEKWDGSGYPDGLKGEEIPLWGRITAVFDVFDALMSKRPYKEAYSKEKSLTIMKQGRGRHFEPKLVDLFMENLDEAFAIHEKYKDA